MIKALRLGYAPLFFALSILITGCQDHSPAQPSDIDTVSKSDQGWPRTIMTSKGPVTLDAAPKRIVSTSVTMTGTLLAIDAPVIASGATIPNSNISDQHGFLSQWSEVAEQRHLKVLYQTEPDAEAVVAARPDLILVSETGGDSARQLYEQFKDIAPTVVLRYDNKSWQELALILGDFLGLEQQAQQAITLYQQDVEKFKRDVTLPPQPTTAMVYYTDNTGANIWTQESAQGRTLLELGFQLANIPNSVRGNISMGVRNDIVIASGEQFADAVLGNTLLLFAADNEQVPAVKQNSYLKQTPSVQHNAVYAVGNDTFRMDYFSSRNLVARLTDLFGQ